MNESIYIAIISSAAGMCIIITGVILLQVRNQRRLLKKQAELSAAAIAHQKDLLQAVIQSQEAERERIGNDLHDEVGATLSSLRMLIEKNVEETTVNTFVVQSKAIIDGVIKNVREIAHQLSPHVSGTYGFYDSLHQLCDNINASGKLKVSLEPEEITLPENLAATTSMAIYRVIAELLNNTIRHARATQVCILFTSKDDTDVLEIRYKDDGIGLTTKGSGGMGMHNIESRLNMIQARWEMQQKNSTGFELFISIPWK
jgi:signal transduction histidine kinase